LSDVRFWLWHEFRAAAVGGEAIVVERCKTAATVPTAKFFKHNLFDVVVDAGLMQPSQDAGNLRCERAPTGGVYVERIEVDEDLQQRVVEPAITHLAETSSGVTRAVIAVCA
jgi:hypothetical protein